MSDAIKPWGGRFSEPTDAFVERFTASVGFDQRLYHHDINGSLAHANMLNKVGILTDDEYQAIEKGLEDIRADIQAGNFEWSVTLEDVHMNIEARLTAKIGDTGKKLHTGRSRNDQVATDIRLYLRDEIDAIAAELTRLQNGLVDLAEREAATIMPGFTHLQVAQPVTFGHHLMAWYEMLDRDYGRLQDCRSRLNQSPLGAAALAGTTFPIDRERTATALGFAGPTNNSLDSVADRDFAIEFCAAAALILNHLSRMSEELILWTSAQFGFISLPDRFCTGSSIMPQKKNPDVPELVRGKSGRVNGHLMSLLTLMKSQPLAYNKDFQEDKEALFDVVATTSQCLEAMTILLQEGLSFRTERLEAAVAADYSNATDVADYLVAKQVPFREAYQLVGAVVKHCLQEGVLLRELTLERWQQFHPAIEADLFEALTPRNVVAARTSEGGTGFDRVNEQLAIWNKRFGLAN